jgi:uncharacterized protein (DUF2164 family)
MPIELPKATEQQALASITRFFLEHRNEAIGNMDAGSLLRFFVAEIGPSLYNQGVADAQQRMQDKVAEIDIDVHEAEFAYWPAQRKSRRPG